MNNSQTASIVCDTEDCIYYNHQTKELLDMDVLYKINRVKEIVYDEEDEVFYILANMYNMKHGLFLVKFDEKNP